jgi:tRNA-Thr(GGU) m(6)t(6)A37 methyltransferase TsaA
MVPMSGETGRDVIAMEPIGVIHSPHTDPDRTPIQAALAAGCRGTIEVFEEYVDGLKDIEGFSHLHILFYFHRAHSAGLVVKPFLDDQDRGVFATRSPNRPNSIGLSIVELLERRGNLLDVDGLDMLDGTPLLDIKPYTTRFDERTTTRDGWTEKVDPERVRTGVRRGPAPR